MDERFTSLLSMSTMSLSSELDLGTFSTSFPSSFLFFLLFRLSLALLELSLEASEELSTPPPLSKVSSSSAKAFANAYRTGQCK